MTDAEIIAKGCNSKGGDVFKALFEGDLSSCDGDASSADLKFRNKLAYLTGKNATRMDRMFRQSKLMRPKWDKRHGSARETYGQLTIAKAILGCRETFDPRAPEFPDLKAEQIPVAELVGDKGAPLYGAHQNLSNIYIDVKCSNNERDKRESSGWLRAPFSPVSTREQRFLEDQTFLCVAFE